MRSPESCALACAGALLCSISPSASLAETIAADRTAASQVAQAEAPTGAASVPAAAAQLAPVLITGKRLDAARNQLAPDTGSTVYRFSKKDVEALPLGEATPLNQVLLQAPGVVQDSYGQLHVRGDHANVQYRVNGVVIPESISGFGQSIDTRLSSQINVLTGALPAQYGYRTAGIVDITTKGIVPGNVGSVSLYGGSFGHREAGVELSGAGGDWSYFATGSFLHDDVGIENPTADRNPIHDTTNQLKGFAYVSKIIDESSRVSVMLGSTNNRFEIPNVPGQQPQFMLDGAGPVDSSALDARQRERTDFQVLTYQASPNDRLDYQLSFFRRFTDVNYRPDPVGDLVYNGIAAAIVRSNTAYGAQGDFSYRLSDAHTLRAGFFGQRESFGVDATSRVFAVTNDVPGTMPLTVVDDTRDSGTLGGVYLQDQWQATKQLTVNYGARYDRVDTVVKEGQLSPRVGVVYELSAATRVHAGYARYFTPPPTEKIDTTSVALFAGTTNALPSDANTAVASERSHYFDVGVSHLLTPELTVGIDAYYRRVKNLQDEGQFGKALIFSAFNYDEGKIGGIELSAAYRKGDLSGYANVAFSAARGRNVVTGQFNFDPGELAYIADHWVHLDHEQTVSGSAGTSYTWAGTRLSADVLYGTGLRSGFANTEHLPGYAQVNAGVERPFDLAGLGRIDARFAITNVFDRLYEIRDGSGIGVGAPQYGPRRGVLLGLTKAF